MTVVDANVFLYAYNEDAPQQRAAAEWLTKLLESGEMIGLPWVTLWAFIRISTNSRIWSNPRPAAEAFAIVREWLAQSGVVALQAGPLHLEILEKLIEGPWCRGSVGYRCSAGGYCDRTRSVARFDGSGFPPFYGTEVGESAWGLDRSCQVSVVFQLCVRLVLCHWYKRARKGCDQWLFSSGPVSYSSGS